ncbi:hypothetical protein MNEG_5940 [Monoraphidium neglectum]|uniref:CCHC-type domain-containing protein n=1 Tax=Monoraphidium neglectum TaxID=145388 RepID=A0A0D2N8C7_9CHLO|nr:hypothetical protein MNEG_5940 [Monoraphidium neglectum]KIZ02016.1 hypothetical protein MNEG_5940 [Monoraphidium neglectum]|eukprot:XP_013901035.1 hypothetical protein MNEG_5940 [Monoraphidium neglectum]
MLRDCTNAASSGASLACARCGRDGCACQGLADFVRFDGLCSGDYHPDDVARTRCFVCGGLGHLSCKPTPLDLPQPSCYNCGDQGHTAAACPQALPPHLKAERAASTRQRALEQMQAQAQAQLQFGQRGGGGGQGYGGGGGGGGGGQAWRQGGGVVRNGDWFGGFPGTGRQQLQQDRQPYAQQQRQPPQQVQHWQQGQQSWQQQPQQQQHWQQQPQQAYGQGYPQQQQQQQQQQRQQQYWPQQQQQPGPNTTDGSRGHGAYGGAAGYGRARDRFSYG